MKDWSCSARPGDHYTKLTISQRGAGRNVGLYRGVERVSGALQQRLPAALTDCCNASRLRQRDQLVLTPGGTASLTTTPSGTGPFNLHFMARSNGNPLITLKPTNRLTYRQLGSPTPAPISVEVGIGNSIQADQQARNLNV